MRTKFLMVMVFFVAVFTSGCSKDYFADDGTLNLDETAALGMSTMDYLKSQGEMFDTLSVLISKTGMEAMVNAKGTTFMAPRDYSIRNYFNLLFPNPDKRPASINDIPQEEMDKIGEILKNYILPSQEIIRRNLDKTYSYVTTLGNVKARFNLVQDDYLGNLNMGAKYIIFSLNMSAPGEKERYQSVQVATADLRSTNGIVHILSSDTHIFGFN